MAASDLIEIHRLPPPTKGVWDGIDPRSQSFPETAGADIANLRVAQGTWKTRKGSALWQTIPGSGNVRWLADFYVSDGSRIRLAARGNGAGAQLFDYKEGTDVNFQTVSGGGSLGGTTEPYFYGVVLGDVYYFLDRAGALRKYTASTRTVTTVAQPTAPVTAPLVRSRPYDVLEDWLEGGGAPYGWTQSDILEYEIQDPASVAPNYFPPTGGKAVRLKGHDDASGETISKNVANQNVPSHTIAFWLLQDLNKPNMQQFQFGLQGGTPTDFSQQLQMPAAQQWMPVFVNIGNIGQISFKQFAITASNNGTDMYIGPLMLPGRLQGAYRWVYTYYNPTTGAESPASPISNGGQVVDLSIVGTSFQPASAAAFSKSAVLTFTAAGSPAKIRIYRNGGVGSLTKNDAGQDIWLRVGEIFDQSTTISGTPAAGATSFSVASATNISIGDWLVLAKASTGTNAEENVNVTNVVGTTITISHGLAYAHTNGQAVQVAFMDNVGNESIDVTQPIELERDDPPTGAKWIARSVDGRLILGNYSGHPTGVAFSNRATPDRPRDYEIFPLNVDPLTRRSPNQGWRFDLRGDNSDESIMWLGTFEGMTTMLTRRHLYVMNANSQLDWGPDAIQPLARTGCINGETVAECDGVLYWVAEGPRIVKWGGRTGEIETISQWRVNARLSAAPVANWNLWFARYHAKLDSHYYLLYFVPQGQTGCTQRIDYAIQIDAYEPYTVLNGSGALRQFQAAAVRDGGVDTGDLYHADSSGQILQTETGTTDAGQAISILAATRQLGLEFVGLLHSLYIWNDGVSDTVTVTVGVEGAEYQNVQHVFTLNLAGTGDREIKQRLTRSLMGRWFSVNISGLVRNGPTIHNASVWVQPVRSGRLSIGQLGG